METRQKNKAGAQMVERRHAQKKALERHLNRMKAFEVKKRKNNEHNHVSWCLTRSQQDVSLRYIFVKERRGNRLFSEY